MADMFGSPVGQSAAERDQRDNLLAGMKAMQMQGEIAQQPADLALKQAHTKAYLAEAAGKEMDVGAQKALMEAAPGIFSKPEEGASLADPLFKMANILGGKGYVEAATKMYDKAATIMSKEAQIESSQATTELREIQTMQKQLAQDSSLAASVNSQEDYDRYRMTLTSMGRNISLLPESYADAKPLLMQVMTAGMKASEILKAREDKINAASLQGRRAMQNKVSDARIAEITANTKVLKEREKVLRKNGGDGSPLTVEGKRALIDSRRARQAVAEARQYPPLPTTHAEVQVGGTYTGANGQRLQAVGRDAEGLPIFKAVPKGTKLTPALPPEEEDDEEDDDE